MNYHVVQFKSLRAYGRASDVAVQFGAVHGRPVDCLIINDEQLEAIERAGIKHEVMSQKKKTKKKR